MRIRKIRKSDYEADLCIVLGHARYDAGLRQEILTNVATMEVDGEPPLEWRRELAKAYGWRPIAEREEADNA